MNSNYNNIKSPRKIRDLDINNLFSINIDDIRKKHILNQYEPQEKKIIYAQLLYYFLFNLLEQYYTYTLSNIDLYDMITKYLTYIKIKSYYNLGDICQLLISKYSSHTELNYISQNELKELYKKNILIDTMKIKQLLDIDNIIEIYGIMKHNYIIEEKYTYKLYLLYNFNRLKIYIINNSIYIGWIIIYSLINICLFLWKFYKYRNNKNAFLLYGYGPAISKGFAQVCLFNTLLVLLPLSFNLLRFLRKFEILRKYVPFDMNVLFHKICGYNILVSGFIHGIAHINTFFNKIQKLDQNIWIKTDLYQKGALRNGRTFHNYISSLPGWTGLFLVIIFIIATPMTISYIKRRNFDIFWYSHYLFFPLYFILIMFHGGNQWFEKTTAWMWAIVPFLLYTIDRLYRYFKKIYKSEFQLLSSEVSSNIVILKIKKDNKFNNYIPSMYLFINIPIISNSEWHPFTIVSNPRVNYITLYIENNGNWTNILYQFIKTKYPIPNIYIDGPVNSPSENYLQYDISIMISGGIGVTPFLSIIKNIILEIYNYKKLGIYNEYYEKLIKNKIYFYWCCKNQNLFDICIKTLNEVIKMDTYNIIEINTYLTSIKKNIHRDILTNIQYISYELINKDIFSNLVGKDNLIKFGRPDFDNIFKNILNTHENKTIGVFFCGSYYFKQEINNKCKKYSINKKNIKFKLYYEYF